MNEKRMPSLSSTFFSRPQPFLLLLLPSPHSPGRPRRPRRQAPHARGRPQRLQSPGQTAAVAGLLSLPIRHPRHRRRRDGHRRRARRGDARPLRRPGRARRLRRRDQLALHQARPRRGALPRARLLEARLRAAEARLRGAPRAAQAPRQRAAPDERAADHDAVLPVVGGPLLLG